MLCLANQQALVHNIAPGEGHVRGEIFKWKGCRRRVADGVSNIRRQPKLTVSTLSKRGT